MMVGGGRRHRSGGRALAFGPVSTRFLIVTALLCGLVILLAFTVQVVIAAR